MAKRVTFALGVSLALVPLATVVAQNADSATTLRATEALNRVRRYTTSDVNMARIIADSLVRALPAEASVMPEALFAKASIAPSAADAEKDYSRIVNEYRFAPRVPDALMRLALLEGARNNRAGAMRHLDRLLRDHSESPVRSRASLMAGRLRLEMNDPARGCELLAAAWASAGLNERDVKDQAEQLGAKCPVSIAERAKRDPAPLGILRAPQESVPGTTVLGTAQTAAGRKRQRDSVLAAQAAVATARRDSIAKASGARPAPKPAPVTAAPQVRVDTGPIMPAASRTPMPRQESTSSQSVLVVQSKSAPQPEATRPAPPAAPRRDSVLTPPVRRDTAPKPVVRRDTAPTVAVRRDSAPKPVVRRDTAPTPKPVAPTPPVVSTEPTNAPAAAASMRYAVQFAAYNDRPGAEEFARTLQQRGIAARVEGTEKPFRVRAGRFGSRAEAEAQASLWRRPGQAAIVVSYP